VFARSPQLKCRAAGMSMSEVADRIKKFIDYAGLLKGDEKGEVQVFCDRFFPPSKCIRRVTTRSVPNQEP
jgi:hypothetical protein